MFDRLWYSAQSGQYAYFAEGRLWAFDRVQAGRAIYRARVLRRAPALSGVFADVGQAHVLIRCDGEPLPAEGDVLYVWEAEPAVGGKLAVCKLHPTLAGRLVVYVADGRTLRFAKGVDPAVRALAEAAFPPDAGCIVRSAVRAEDVPHLAEEWQALHHQWQQLTTHVGVGLLHRSEVDPAPYFARATEAWCDDEALSRDYNARYVPDLAAKMAQTVLPEVETSGNVVTTPEGVELVIEHTEACWVVDVNSRGYATDLPAAEAALAVNRIAAKEVCRQMCLRDMTGAVLVDFINLPADYRPLVWQALKDVAGRDNRIHLVDFTKLGFAELTRSVV